MGTSQILMTVCAMFLLGIILLSANTAFLQNDTVIKESEFGVAAVSLATSLVEEVQGKAFDEAATDSGVTVKTQLTPYGYLGPDANELYHSTDPTKTDFDDVDDFNGFTIEYVANTAKPQVAQYRGDASGFRSDYFVRATVVYVTANGGVANLGTPSVSRTWHKKLTVTVTSPSSKDTLSFPTILSYWN